MANFQTYTGLHRAVFLYIYSVSESVYRRFDGETGTGERCSSDTVRSALVCDVDECTLEKKVLWKFEDTEMAVSSTPLFFTRRHPE